MIIIIILFFVFNFSCRFFVIIIFCILTWAIFADLIFRVYNL